MRSSYKRNDYISREAISDIQDVMFDVNYVSQTLKRLQRYLAVTTSGDSLQLFVPANGKSDFEESKGKCELFGGNNSTSDPQLLSDETIVEKCLLTGKFSLQMGFYNHPIPKHTKQLLLKNSGYNNLMIVPLKCNKQIIAVFLIASQQKSFSKSILQRIKPVFDATEAMLSFRRNMSEYDQSLEEGFFKSLDLKQLMQFSIVGMVIINENHKIVCSNSLANKIFNSNRLNDVPKAIIGLNISEFIPLYDSLFHWRVQANEINKKFSGSGPLVFNEIHGVSLTGKHLFLSLSILKFHHQANEYTLIQFNDSSTEIAKNKEYRDTAQQLTILNQSLPIAILRIDSQWNCQLCNQQWELLTGLENTQEQGRGWVNGFHPDEVEMVLEKLHQKINKGEDLTIKTRLKHVNGSTRWVDLCARVLREEDGEVNGFVVTFNDITEHYIAQEKLKEIAQFDALTGLTNRKTFQDRLTQSMQLSERTNQAVCLFFIDLDGFKDVNDSLGHSIGDRVLQITAERLVNTLRKSDTVARFGGDEFVVLLGGEYKAQDINAVAHKIIDNISQSLTIGVHEIVLTASLGIAQGTAANYSALDLLKLADAALYRAKRMGKNRVEQSTDLNSKVPESRLEFLNELRFGLKKHRYALHYQPIVDTNTGEVLGVETLLRFKRNSGLLVSPDQFMQILEDSGLIIAVGKWVVCEALRQYAYWIKHKIVSENFILSVNVSSKEFLNGDFVEMLLSEIEKHSLNSSNILIEITENMMLSQTEDVKNDLNLLKSSGIRFAVDDFGTGYSSLSYLQQFPIDVVKIDKSFIDDLSENSNDIKITRAIIALAESLNLFIIAEGVETIETLEKLKNLGAQSVQGFYLCHPLASGELEDFLVDKNTESLVVS